MSKTYGKATPVGDGDRVTYTPQAAIIEVAARGGFSEHDILDVRDLLLVGLARQCGGTCWQPDHSNPEYASLLSPAGSRGWNIGAKWRIELHVESHVESHPVDPEWPPHEELWVRLDGSWRGACRDAVDLRRHSIRLDPTSGPTGAPAVPPLATNPAPLNGRQSLLDGIAGPVEDRARIVLRSVDDAIGALNAPPPMPQLWVVTGRWGGLHTEAETREELLANLGEHAAVDGDDVYLCPCDGDHNPGCDGSVHLGQPCDDDFCEGPCGCEPGCRGGCWDDEAPDGCWQTITALHDTAVPVVRDQTVGWSRAMWHNHSPGPGGLMVLPKPETNSDFGCWSCAGWNCGSVIYDGDIDIACDFHEDIDDDTQDAIIELWTETGRESLKNASDALDVHT